MRSPWQVLKNLVSRGTSDEAESDAQAPRSATTVETEIPPVDETEQRRPASVEIEPTLPLLNAGVNTGREEPAGIVATSVDGTTTRKSAPIKATSPNASAFAVAVAKSARPPQALKKRPKPIKSGFAAVPPKDAEPSVVESGIALDIEIQQLRSRLGAKLREQNSQLKTLLDRYESS
jgi:hypothetical protein